jgi:hypothetical protein
VPEVAWGKEVAVIASGVRELPIAVAETTTGMVCDSALVSWFCTWSLAVEGVARLLLPMVPVRAVELTREVEIGEPFQRMTAALVKFVPVTLRVWVWEPAGIVCGVTWLMLGAAGPVMPEPQPRQKMMRVMLTLAAIVLITFPKLHPEENQTCYPYNGIFGSQVEALGMNVTG